METEVQKADVTDLSNSVTELGFEPRQSNLLLQALDTYIIFLMLLIIF